MSAAFQLGLLLLFAATVQCGKPNSSSSGHMTKTLDNNLQKQADAKIFCTVCKSVANRVLKIIKDKLSKDNIDMALDGICKKVGATALCRRFIQKYREKLINAIAAGGTAEKICKSLKLCNDLRLHFQ